MGHFKIYQDLYLVQLVNDSNIYQKLQNLFGLAPQQCWWGVIVQYCEEKQDREQIIIESGRNAAKLTGHEASTLEKTAPCHKWSPGEELLESSIKTVSVQNNERWPY